MTLTSPTFAQVKALVAMIRRKIPQARVIGIRAPGRWSGERQLQDGNDTYVIAQCDSPLAMRLALHEQVPTQAVHVLITNLEDQDVGEEILLRLTKRRLFSVESSQILKSLFQAQEIDPRLPRQSWIAESLMSWSPAEGYPPVSGGFLDAETVWAILLRYGMNLTVEHPDLQAVLRWSIDAEQVARYRAASAAFREAATQWLAGLVGTPVTAILACVTRNERPDAVPIGLAAAVLCHPHIAGRLDKAMGKFEERYLGGASPDEGTLRRWSGAATTVVQSQLTDPKQKRQQLTRADEILAEVGADSFAHLSDTSPLGFTQRLASFGEWLKATLSSDKPRSVAEMMAARQAVLAHKFASREHRRHERIEMAVRLVRWLIAGAHDRRVPPRSLGEAAAFQVAEDSFVDWARLSLRSGDPVHELSEAYARLWDRVTEKREEQARRFAGLLKDSTATGSPEPRIIAVENILARVVAPLAAQTPVLVVVIDGMSTAVWRELVADITRHDWVALTTAGNPPAALVGLATIPSITEGSRASLLCGQLRRGGAQDEQAGFAAHPALLAHCRAHFPPILFHKASLQEEEDAGLASEVRKEIAAAHRRIVGVVLNAVDDHLLKGEQLDTAWNQEQIKVLRALLHEAQQARRVVVFLSDHGHVLDDKTVGKVYEGGERWREDDGAPEETELQVSGPRVLIPESHALIAPWTERLRYGIKKNGYHGGLTPQEMVVPIGVLCSTHPYPQGWHEAPADFPPWWEEPLTGGGNDRDPARHPKPLSPPPAQPAGPLFDWAAAQAPAARPPRAWITTLVSSPLFAEQKKRAGRAVPSDEVMIRLLAVLDDRGGTMTSAALTRALDCPALRLRGLLAITQRVLNIDGYAILTRDEASDTVELNRDLLFRQFAVG